MNDAELVQKMRELQNESSGLEDEMETCANEMIEIIRRHPDKTELAARVPAGHIILYVVYHSGGAELKPGCGCTFGTTFASRSELPKTEHPDGQRLYELEQLVRSLYQNQCLVAERLMALLDSLGLGKGLRTKHWSDRD